MIKKPTKRPSYYDGLDNTNITIKKMIELYEILLYDTPNDKRFKKYYFNYINDLCLIAFRIENGRYTDEEIKRDIDILYYKIFKNRRHL